MINKLCPICHKDFQTYPSQHRKYCSKECADKARTGSGCYWRWRGGIKTDGEYVREYVVGENRWVAQHKAIMERHLGRKLKQNEVVHHINGNKKDNRIENLTVMDKVEHSRLHNPLGCHKPGRPTTKVEHICPWCHKKFTAYKSQRFCSKHCGLKARYNSISNN